MNKSFFISLIMVLTIAQLYVSAKHLKKPGQTCSNSCQCSTRYCRDGECKQYGEVADEKDEDGKSQISPCKYARCTAGYDCVIQQIQCFTFPCPGNAVCINNRTTCS